MATSLYETLGLSREATLDDIRKAYKKKALQTHPDRLPQGSTAEDKTNSEEQFRLVNNAYEILSDPQKRKVYDEHGIFPPPQPERHFRPDHSRRHYSQGNPFDDPFMSRGFSSFVFTDPFALFDEIFGKEFPEWSRHRSHFHGHSHFMGFDPLFGPFSNPSHGIGGLQDIFGLSSGFPHHTMLSPHAFPPIESPSRHRRQRGVMQESYMTQTINGVTQSVHKKIDVEGNEHITRTFPDGRKVYTINGAEQLPSVEPRDQRHLLADRHDSRSQAIHQSAQPPLIHVARSNSPPPPYPDYESNAYSISPPPDPRHRDYRNRYEHHVVDNGYDVYDHDANRRIQDDRHRRRWRPSPW